MMEKRRRIKWLLFVFCLLLILYFNLQDAKMSMDLSNATGAIVATVSPIKKTWIQQNIRKLAHTGEYFLLGMSSYWCFGWRGLLIDSGVSFLDQCFKGVIPIRHFDWSDIPYDMVGYMIGCFVGRLIIKIMREYKNAHQGEI